jgi:hypothetical protein
MWSCVAATGATSELVADMSTPAKIHITLQEHFDCKAVDGIKMASDEHLQD